MIYVTFIRMKLISTIIIFTLIFLTLSCKKEESTSPEIKELLGKWYSDSTNHFEITRYSYKPSDTTELSNQNVEVYLDFKPGFSGDFDGQLSTYYIQNDSIFTDASTYPKFHFLIEENRLTTKRLSGVIDSDHGNFGSWYTVVMEISHFNRGE